MYEGCGEAGKYCGTKRHTKSLKSEYPDLSLINFCGWIKCGNCERVLDWKVFGKQIIYRLRNRNEYVSEVESSETDVP
jgi:hypothetical protein